MNTIQPRPVVSDFLRRDEAPVRIALAAHLDMWALCD